MNNIKAMSASLALLLGVGTFTLGPASAAPLTGSLGTRLDSASPQLELVAENDWWWRHGRRHRDDHHRFFHDGLWFAVPFWAGATTAPLYADSYYDDDFDDDFDEDFSAAHYEYCFGRYRSYDMETNTFMGYDGLRHPCISPYG
jgi:hypothetical protein